MAIQKTITINGHTRLTSEYGRFLKMRQRCLNPNDKAYPAYGGRGIRICNGWESFERFVADLGERPSPEHSMDRVDNNGHYSCGKCDECLLNGWPPNCRWATPRQQANNIRSNVRITKNNETRTLSEWAEVLNVSFGTLWSRYSRGLTHEEVLAPVTKRRAYPRKRNKAQAIDRSR